MKTVMLVVGTCLVLALVASPVDAGRDRERWCNDGVDNDGDGWTDCEDRDCRKNVACTGEHIWEAAVGHALNCRTDPVCADLCNPTGDFYDRGNSINACGLLTCGGGGNQTLTCSPRGFGQPRVDILGLFHLWDDPEAQGHPEVCFPEGWPDMAIVGATVQVPSAGTAGFDVRVYFWSGVDSSLAVPPYCLDAPDEVLYGVYVDACEASPNYPPAPGETATVTCAAGSTVRVASQGGGKVAKKCGCRASGTLLQDTELRFRGL